MKDINKIYKRVMLSWVFNIPSIILLIGCFIIGGNIFNNEYLAYGCLGLSGISMIIVIVQIKNIVVLMKEEEEKAKEQAQIKARERRKALAEKKEKEDGQADKPLMNRATPVRN
jgi:uncharacterized membrane protein